MQSFKSFAAAVSKRFDLMASRPLFKVNVSQEVMWALYLQSFPEGTDPVHKTNTTHDCNCCRHFIRDIGNVVTVENGEIQTIWSSVDYEYPYSEVAARMDRLIKDSNIISAFQTDQRKFGAIESYSNTAQSVDKWNHFYVSVPLKHINALPATIIGNLNQNFSMLRDAVEKISDEAITTVLDLIDANSLYRGAQKREIVAGFQAFKAILKGKDERQRINLMWLNSATLLNDWVRIKNDVTGTLLIDLSEGRSVEDAVASFETKVAPANYQRTTALITPKMVESAIEKFKSLGLDGAEKRRHASIQDISINNVLWADRSKQHLMRDGLAAALMPEAVRVTLVEGSSMNVTIENFVATVLPKATKLELFVDNSLEGNFMSISAPVIPSDVPLFNWNNNFAWSYDGNVTDSIRQRVKKAGGNVDAVFRVSLSWFNTDDLDISCILPDGEKIYFGNKRDILDVDMNVSEASASKNAVENLSWVAPKDGLYQIYVKNFSRRNSINVGFEIEIENKGSVNLLSYPNAIAYFQSVNVCNITIKDQKIVDIKAHSAVIPGVQRSAEKWGISTSQFQPVSAVMLSPNFWDGQRLGNKHWFFILEGCKNPIEIRGMYNEFLRSELHPHRKVFEILGDKFKCPVVDEQLSGIGFSSTVSTSFKIAVTKGAQRTVYNVVI